MPGLQDKNKHCGYLHLVKSKNENLSKLCYDLVSVTDSIPIGEPIITNYEDVTFFRQFIEYGNIFGVKIKDGTTFSSIWIKDKTILDQSIFNQPEIIINNISKRYAFRRYLSKDNIELYNIIKKQYEALSQNKVQFLLYNGGSGGEFLTSKISEYSNNNYFKFPNKINELNRNIQKHYFLGSWFMHGYGSVEPTYDIPFEYDNCQAIYGIGKLSPRDRISAFENTYALLSHWDSDKPFLCKTHRFLYPFMNYNNSWYLVPDNEDMINYTKKLAKIKINLELNEMSVNTNLKKIKMSKMFDKGYLEEIFNIDSDNFHNELMTWHENNLRLISLYKS
jgi:hypothetical protein